MLFIGYIRFSFARGILNGSGAVNHFISGTIASLLHLKLEDEFLDLLIDTYKVDFCHYSFTQRKFKKIND